MKRTNPSLNPQIAAWLDAGYMREALLGEGECFLRDPTYRTEHNVLLVMQTILDWAYLNHTENTTAASLRKICTDLADSGKVSQLRDVVLAYDVASRDQKITLDLAVDDWHKKLPEELKWKKTEPANPGYRR